MSAVKSALTMSFMTIVPASKVITAFPATVFVFANTSAKSLTKEDMVMRSFCSGLKSRIVAVVLDDAVAAFNGFICAAADFAVANAARFGGSVIETPQEKPNGLYEATILSAEGYAFTAAVPSKLA
jgi:hypothetical protein